MRDNAQALSDFRAELLPTPWPTATSRRCRTWRSRRSPGSARCRAADPACRRWSAYTALQRVSPSELVDRIVHGAARRGPGRRRGPRGSRAAGSARFTRLVEGDARRRIAEEKGPEHVADVAIRPTHRPARLHRRPQGRPRGDAARDLPAGPAARHPADPGAPRPPARPAGLPAYRPRVDLHRRRAADHPPQAEAAAPHRAGRALRRQRLGRQLRAVHAAAGVRAARPVPEGAGVHVHRPRRTR